MAIWAMRTGGKRGGTVFGPWHLYELDEDRLLNGMGKYEVLPICGRMRQPTSAHSLLQAHDYFAPGAFGQRGRMYETCPVCKAMENDLRHPE